MTTLTASVVAVVVLAALVGILAPGGTAGAVLALGAPFVLFASVMTLEPPREEAQACTVLFVDWV